jgi:hypothetical protein
MEESKPVFLGEYKNRRDIRIINKPAILLTIIYVFLMFPSVSFCQDELVIWKEFVTALMNEKMTLDRIRPLGSIPRETLMEWLNVIKKNVSLKELKADPEFHRVDNKVHFIVPLTFEAPDVDYCFSFLIEEDEWYFHILETIFIRLDKIKPPPTTEFPDISEERKAFDREEWRVSKQVRLFKFLSEEKGKDFAFNWFKDGYGFFSATQVRVPFYPPPKAFVLYLCWHQANLRGNSVRLVQLEENEAMVEMRLIYFDLYKRAAHLKEQISFEDYRKIFETMWHDRAEKAGWDLDIEYHEGFDRCVFKFIR